MVARLILGWSLLCVSLCSVAKVDTIKIQSNTAKFEQQSGQASYEGDVILFDTEHQLHADHLIIHKNKQGKLTKVVATGNPAIFTGKVPDEEQMVQAQANEITLYPQQSLLKLNEDAKIRYNNDTFVGPLLEYRYKDNVIIANSANRQRPQITLETPKIKNDS